MQIAYIHGFNSSHHSFNYVAAKLPEHEIVVVNYNSHQSMDQILPAVKRQLPKKPFALIGHSLGGVVATLIAAAAPELITHLATVSSPLGGSKAAATLKWLPGYPKIMSDITPSSVPIKTLSKLKLEMPTLCIVSTGGGLPTSNEANDSVVTVASQKALKFGKKLEVKANHFEILLHLKTVQLLQDFLFEEADSA